MLIKPKPAAGDWIQYWDQDETWTASELWTKNAQHFLKKAARYISPTNHDKVLDIGCGPGIIAELLAPQVQTLIAADTSERYLRLCAERCKNLSNVSVARIPANYTNIHELGRFSLFLCNSVVQYYKSPQELEDLIASARKAALPKARMLISDIPIVRHFSQRAGDAFAAFFQSTREGFGWGYFKMAAKLLLAPSYYSEFSKKHETLHYETSFLERLPKRLGLKGSLIRESLSLCTQRPSLLIQFH